MNPLRSLFLLCTALLLVALSACAPLRQGPELGATKQKAAELLASGKADAAARLYLQAATGAPSPERQRLQMLAARILIDQHRYPQAQAILERIDGKGLNPTDLARLELLRAQIEYAQDRPAAALAALPSDVGALPAPLAAQILALRARAAQAAGRPLAALEARLQRQPLLEGEAAQRNLQSLWTELQQTPPTQIEALRQEARGAARAWLDLALIAQDTPPETAALERALSAWAQAHPRTAAEAAPIVARLRAEWRSFQAYPEQIAVLLPLSGPYRAAGRSILDGIMSAYYALPASAPRPALRIYDTADDAEGIAALYRRAVADGARFVIGPLLRTRVRALVSAKAVSVPTLALNYLRDPQLKPPDAFYEFGLDPENQARQATEKAVLDGRRDAVVLAPDTPWGARVAQAFEQRFTELGGRVLSVGRFAQQTADYSAVVAHALGIDRSQARMRALAATLGRRLEFVPRRRQDVDMIFIAADPRQARLLLPLIAFHHGEGLPVYSISTAYSGTPDPTADRDLDGLIFCDAPLLLAQEGPAAEARHTLQRDFPQVAGQEPRLYALGADSFGLIPILARMRQQPWLRYPGLGGTLQLSGKHRIEARLSWAKFVAGVPQRIPTAPAQVSHGAAP